MLIFTCDARMKPEVMTFVTNKLCERTGQKCVLVQFCNGVVQTQDERGVPLLVFTVTVDMSMAQREELEKRLSDETGQRCLVFTMYSGVIQISEKCPNQCDQRNESCDDVAKPFPEGTDSDSKGGEHTMLGAYRRPIDDKPALMLAQKLVDVILEEGVCYKTAIESLEAAANLLDSNTKPVSVIPAESDV